MSIMARRPCASGSVGISSTSARPVRRQKQRGFGGEGLVASHAVDGPAAGRRDQPGAWVGRVPIAGPAVGGDGERLLRGLLGEVEVAEEADEGGDHAPPLVAEGLFEHCYHCMIGRTSMAPPKRAAGMRAASSMAASRSSASNSR